MHLWSQYLGYGTPLHPCQHPKPDNWPPHWPDLKEIFQSSCWNSPTWLHLPSLTELLHRVAACHWAATLLSALWPARSTAKSGWDDCRCHRTTVPLLHSRAVVHHLHPTDNDDRPAWPAFWRQRLAGRAAFRAGSFSSKDLSLPVLFSPKVTF